MVQKAIFDIPVFLIKKKTAVLERKYKLSIAALKRYSFRIFLAVFLASYQLKFNSAGILLI